VQLRDIEIDVQPFRSIPYEAALLNSEKEWLLALFFDE
jgi:hypothetical protein